MSSAISGARQALYQALVEWEGLSDDWQRAFGSPLIYEGRQVVTLMGVGRSLEEPAGTSLERREVFTLTVGIKAAASTSPAEVDALGFAAADQVRACVTAKANATLGEAVTWAQVVAQETDGVESIVGDGGRVSGYVIYLVLTIECEAFVI